MPRSCCIVGCKTGSKSNHNTIKASTFSFPTDENLKKKWMDKIPQKDLIVTKNSGVCASHFTDDQIIRTWTSGVGDKQVCINLKYPKLKEDAIPRIFPGPKYLLNPQTERRAPRKRDSSLISSKNIKVVEGSESPKMVANEETFDENSLAEANSKEQYKEMKRKLRLLVYENEIFQQTLKATQRKLLKVSRDKNVLLDRLIVYEMVDLSSSDDELTESSDEGDSVKPEPKKRKDPPATNSSSGTSKQSISPQRTNSNPAKKRKPSTPKASKSASMPLQSNESHSNNVLSAAESSKTMAEPKSGNSFSQHGLATDMFNDTFSVKSESNSMYDIDTSPNNIAEDMINVDGIGK